MQQTPIVDLRQTSMLAEIILRAGDVGTKDAFSVLQVAYARTDAEFARAYPGVTGLSCVFRQGATLDELARAAHFPHGKLSFSVLASIVNELAAVGYSPILFATPVAGMTYHHSLAVARGSIVEPTLSAAAGNALIRALTVIDNPYKALKP